MTDREQMVAKIERILRKCDPSANTTEEEVKAAMGMAQRLMRDYDVEMAEVLAAKGEELDLDAIGETIVREHSKTDRHELSILNAICLITGVKAYTTKVRKDGKVKKQMVVYGAKADMAVAHAMFAELIVLVRAMARIRVKGKWCQKHYWYCNGFGNGMYGKAVQLHREQQWADAAPETAPNHNTTALIVRKDALIERYAVERLHLRPARRSRGSANAYNSGEYAKGTNDGRDYECREKLGSNGAPSGLLEG